MNCIGIRGDPVEGVERNERGLCPLGVNKENEGTVGSGVRGGVDASLTSGASSNIAELIHFSSRARTRGGESGRRRKTSAK